MHYEQNAEEELSESQWKRCAELKDEDERNSWFELENRYKLLLVNCTIFEWFDEQKVKITIEWTNYKFNQRKIKKIISTYSMLETHHPRTHSSFFFFFPFFQFANAFHENQHRSWPYNSRN